MKAGIPHIHQLARWGIRSRVIPFRERLIGTARENQDNDNADQNDDCSQDPFHRKKLITKRAKGEMRASKQWQDDALDKKVKYSEQQKDGCAYKQGNFDPHN
jgi:hypothetical protein